MDTTFLKTAFNMAQINFKENEPLAQKSTFKVGGKAELFVIPQNISQLQSALAGTKAAELPFFLLGGGSNVVFPDNTYNGIIISTEKLNTITMTDDIPETLQENQILVTCECGTPTAAFVNFCTTHNLSGAEQFAGLPGTIGGAVYMNARCFEKSICDIIYQTEHIDYSIPTKSKIVTKPFDSSEWAYKSSPFKKDKCITSATFILTKKTEQEHQQIEDECKKYISERVNKGHFKFPSAGSVFKNNHNFGSPSGKIIDNAGLRGHQIGGAQIAPFHGNFIINTGNATASDIKQLVEYTQKQVKNLYGFELEPEIIFVN